MADLGSKRPTELQKDPFRGYWVLQTTYAYDSDILTTRENLQSDQSNDGSLVVNLASSHIMLKPSQVIFHQIIPIPIGPRANLHLMLA